MQPDDTYSPVLHRINQAVRWRAVHPRDNVPPPAEILMRFSNPPEKLIADNKAKLDSLIAAADVKLGKVSAVFAPTWH